MSRDARLGDDLMATTHYLRDGRVEPEVMSLGFPFPRAARYGGVDIHYAPIAVQKPESLDLELSVWELDDETMGRRVPYLVQYLNGGAWMLVGCDTLDDALAVAARLSPLYQAAIATETYDMLRDRLDADAYGKGNP